VGRILNMEGIFTMKSKVTKESESLSMPKNPNKRPCIARNISFSVQSENEYWLRQLNPKRTFKKELI
jgi:hypothetical protein